MLNIGFGELALILAIAIIVVGPDRLPEMVRFLGRQYGKLMRASDELRRAFVLEADRVDAEQRADALRARREEARKRAAEARENASLAGEGAADAPVARDGSDDAEVFSPNVSKSPIRRLARQDVEHPPEDEGPEGEDPEADVTSAEDEGEPS